MTDILILTASFGMGHNSVSKAVKEHVECENYNFNIQIEDLFNILNPKIKEFGSKMYDNLTEHYPLVYNTIYDIKKTNKNNIFDSLLCTTYYKKLYSFICAANPKVIISTFPLCSCLVSKIKKQFNLKTNLITIITDVVDSWEWIYEGTNMYLVPSYDVKEHLIKKGISENIITVTGIPVKKTFLNNNYRSSASKNTLLIIASGMTDDEDIANTLLKDLNKKIGLKTIVVTGRNEKLYKQLSSKTYSNIQILGFVNNIDELMDESVFLVTKPGGVTLFEAINKGLPLIIKDSGIGQEKGNIDFIRRNKLGIVIKDNQDLLNVVDEYIRNPIKANILSRNIRNIKSNLKSNSVAECVLSEVN